MTPLAAPLIPVFTGVGTAGVSSDGVGAGSAGVAVGATARTGVSTGFGAAFSNWGPLTLITGPEAADGGVGGASSALA